MINFIHSKKDKKAVSILQSKMAEFYSKSASYYKDINFAVSNWDREGELAYQRILKLCHDKRVAEVGCGEAAILATAVPDSMEYTGCDFSEALMEANRKKYPGSKFLVIEQATEIPLPSNTYDFVFCVFVLEHVVQPERFLQELARCCKKGGKIAILCPDYAGRSGIASQVVGFSNGSGMEKIRKGRLVDGLLTGCINKLMMPLYLRWKLRNASNEPVFLLNSNPACFCRPFFPDADAVYVTHVGEIHKTLERLGCEVLENNQGLSDYIKQGRLLFIEAVKTR